MLPRHIRWSSIELLHNVVRTLNALNEQGEPLPHVQYRAKVKLHGTNAGVQVLPGLIQAQSRSRLLTTKDDNQGFARWVAANPRAFGSGPRRDEPGPVGRMDSV